MLINATPIDRYAHLLPRSFPATTDLPTGDVTLSDGTVLSPFSPPLPMPPEPGHVSGAWQDDAGDLRVLASRGPIDGVTRLYVSLSRSSRPASPEDAILVIGAFFPEHVDISLHPSPTSGVVHLFERPRPLNA